MSQNLQIDPVKRDYVFINGSPVPSDRVYESSYFALLIPKTKYLYEQPDVDQGSLLWTIKGKRTNSVEQQFFAYSRQAIDTQVIANDLASNVDITNLSVSPVGSSNEVAVTPSAGQLSTEFNFVSV